VGETRQLASFAAGLRLGDCPPAVVRHATRCVVETLGCALGGARSELTEAAVRSVERQADGGAATVVARRLRAAPDRAAYLNAISANALDYDGGIVRQGHYGPTAVCAALAVGEMTGASGQAFLEAVVAGYEVVSRVGGAIRASEAQRQWVSGYGPHQGFAAAAAAGRLLGLGVDGMVTTFGICGAFAPVPSAKQWNWHSRPLSWTKDMVAWPCMTGINAALLAESGFVGPRAIFEGEKGFYRMAGSDRYAPEALCDGLGTDFALLHGYFKPYPCCRWSHAAVDGIAEILERRGWKDADVHGVEVGVAQEVRDDLDDGAPRTLVDAEFSLPYAAALALLQVPPGPGWHDPDLRESPGVRAAMAKVRVRVDPRMERLFTEHGIVGAAVAVHGRDGSSERSRVEAPRGGEERPLSDDELAAKFRGLAETTLTEASSERALRTLVELADLPDVRQLGQLLLG
jgi:2-methylcitrate dehydratase PrpD